MTVRRADDSQHTLLENGSTNGNDVQIPGGMYMLMVEGTFGAGNLALQVKSPNGTYLTPIAYSQSAAPSGTSPYAIGPIDLPACIVRMSVLSGTPSGIYAYLIGMG